jgi:hypothetical protein
MIKPIPIKEASATGIDGADVFIADEHRTLKLFVGSLYGAALWKLHEIATKIGLSKASITKIDYACKLYLKSYQASDLKNEIDFLRKYTNNSNLLNEKCLHNLDVLDAAADWVLEHPDNYIYIIGD